MHTEHMDAPHGGSQIYTPHIIDSVHICTVPILTVLRATSFTLKKELKRQGVGTKEVGKEQKAQNP